MAAEGSGSRAALPPARRGRRAAATKTGVPSRAAASLALAALSLALVFAVAELVLRAAPGLISREVLLEFERPLRARVAERLGLPLKQTRRCLAPSERGDGGPELCLVAPGDEVHQQADPVDRALGARERLPHDARGFCNPPAAAARPRADVVALGDSFTWCTAVAAERTWPAALEASTGLAVYDLGVPGVGLHEYVEVLARFGLALAPRVVVVGVYGGNDLRDARRFAEHRARDGREDAREPGSLLLRHSYAANFAAGAVEVLAQRLRRPEIDFAYDVEQGGRPVAMNRGGGDLDEVRIARALAAGEVSPALWDAPLARLAGLAGEHGFRVVVAYLPSAHAAWAPDVRFADPEVGAQVQALDAAQRRALPELAARHGMAYVDCTPALHAAASGAELPYFPGNLHPTAAGHAAIAACVAPAVEAALDGATGGLAGGAPGTPADGAPGAGAERAAAGAAPGAGAERAAAGAAPGAGAERAASGAASGARAGAPPSAAPAAAGAAPRD
jgi:lysophospholipase L1-like esterase